MFDPSDDADNGDPRRVCLVDASDLQALANRVLVRPELLRHVIIDNRNKRFAGGVIVLE